MFLPFFLYLAVQSVDAAWKDLWLDFVTGTPASASVIQEHLAGIVMHARRVTGVSLPAVLANVMDTLMSVTRGPEPASVAGATLEGTSVKGDIWSFGQIIQIQTFFKSPRDVACIRKQEKSKLSSIFL